MTALVALALEPSPEFVAEMLRIWEGGDAIAPIDTRLPAPARQTVLDAIAPTWIIDESGLRRHDAGTPAEPGDAVVIATSGTTGKPRGVVHTHDSIAAAARITNTALDVDPAVDRWWSCLPVSHVGGLGVVTRAVLSDTPVHVSGRCDPADPAAADATLTALVPAALRTIDTSRFRRVLLGGSAIPEPRPANTVATYGLTETFGGVVYDGAPLDGVEVRITSDDRIQIRSPSLLRCYRDGTVPIDGDGWFTTSDIGRIDVGRLTVVGRLDDVIITGGQKVWPDDVEAALADAPGIAEVAVVGRRDERWGHTVTAVVVPISPDDPPTLDELRDRVKRTLPPYAAPRRLEIVSTLPRTPLGKIRRADL